MPEKDCGVSPAAWHVDPVSPQDDAMIRQIMANREYHTGETQTKSGTIRRAVRALWRREVDEGVRRHVSE